LASPEAVGAIAERAEALGFAHLAVTDHLVVPKRIGSRYPYSQSGEFPGASSGACFDQFTLLAYLAAISTKPRLVTSVTVIPHRGAVHTAKIMATIDVLSHGRTTLGVGAGWMKEEFDALGVPAFEARGKVTDEYLEAFKILWTEDDPHFDGHHVTFGTISFLPKPLQNPHPPIWIGGESKPAMRRAVRYGDVWFPVGNNPRHPLNTAALFKGGVEKLHRMAEEHGRDPASLALALFANRFEEGKAVALESGERQILTGKAEDVAADIDALADLGVHDLIFNFERGTLEATLDSMQHFVDVIQPLTT
ncbi:MAG: TIGR03619 family F420-dependent LLM class oxidoreductase, partial [Geminicoccaceae bacterium]